MSDKRKEEIINLLTDNPETVNFLCSLTEDRYQIVFDIMRLVKLLEHQKISRQDIKAAEKVQSAYSLEDNSKLSIMAFMYGKIQGKREERLKRKR
jgi:hypothetical protein